MPDLLAVEQTPDPTGLSSAWRAAVARVGSPTFEGGTADHTDPHRPCSDGGTGIGPNNECVAKPFHYPELLARVVNLIERRSGVRSGPIRVGPLSVDPATREVKVGERRVELANKEYALLSALIAEPSRVFTKQELLEDVWGYQAASRTRTLDSHASRVRRKLDPDRGRFVVNCWGVPYRHLLNGIPIGTERA